MRRATPGPGQNPWGPAGLAGAWARHQAPLQMESAVVPGDDVSVW